MGLWKDRSRKKPAAKASVAPGRTARPGTPPPPAGEIATELGILREKAASLEASLQEARQQHANQTQRTLLGIIEAIDAFDRVFRSIRAKDDQVTPQMKLWIGNFRTILRLLNRVLSEHDVLPIQNLEDGFDPHWHQAIETIDDPDRPEGTILDEVLKGYVWRDRILRKTSVVVTCRPAVASHSGGSATDGSGATVADVTSDTGTEAPVDHPATDGHGPAVDIAASGPTP